MSAEKTEAEKYKQEAEIWRKKFEGNNDWCDDNFNMHS